MGVAIEFKVPISDIEYDGAGLWPKFGIETRFVRACVHYAENGDVSAPGSTYDKVDLQLARTRLRLLQ